MTEKPVAAGKSSFELINAPDFFANIKIPSGAQVLDLACGAGKYSIEISKRLGGEGSIYAVDLWDEGIETLKRTIREENIANVHPIKADITKRLPLEDGSIDFCLMATILHDLPPEGLDSALKEVVRVLKRGGVLTVIEFKKIDRGPGPPMSIRISEEECEEKIKGYGFVKTYGGEVGQFNYVLLFRKTG